jgi:signal transduction histidine kinase
VGQLAAGVAHEINTPIQYVGDSVHFMRDACRDLLTLCGTFCDAALTPADPSEALALFRSRAQAIDLEYLLQELPKAMEQTLEGVQRVAGIVSALKDFGRPDARDKTLVDVNHCLETTIRVAYNELKRAADLVIDFGELPPVPCYPGELNQVLLNLLVNAAHAVSEKFGPRGERGSIRITTARQGSSALIRVSDNGVGIKPEHRTRIFEPFFTTKPVGNGTGQGLAIARSIVVEKHGGSLAFESVPGQGTSFSLLLPLPEDQGVKAGAYQTVGAGP